VLLLIALFAPLLFSIGFLLSVTGVFYIYLFLKYTKNFHKILIFVLFNFWIYVAMFIIVHYFFGGYWRYQFLSIFLTILFSAFYPLALFLHIIGYGDFADRVLMELLKIDFGNLEVYTSNTQFIIYIILSLFAVYHKIGFIILNLFIGYYFLNLSF
jgi:competence protein ComEC